MTDKFKKVLNVLKLQNLATDDKGNVLLTDDQASAVDKHLKDADDKIAGLEANVKTKDEEIAKLQAKVETLEKKVKKTTSRLMLLNPGQATKRMI